MLQLERGNRWPSTFKAIYRTSTYSKWGRTGAEASSPWPTWRFDRRTHPSPATVPATTWSWRSTPAPAGTWRTTSRSPISDRAPGSACRRTRSPLQTATRTAGTRAQRVPGNWRIHPAPSLARNPVRFFSPPQPSCTANPHESFYGVEVAHYTGKHRTCTEQTKLKCDVNGADKMINTLSIWYAINQPTTDHGSESSERFICQVDNESRRP